LRIYSRIAELVKKYPWWIVAASLVVTIVLGFGLLSLQGVLTYQSFLPKQFTSIKALNDLARDFDGISYEQVLLRGPDMTDNRMVRFLVSLEDYINADPALGRGQIVKQPGQKGAGVPQILKAPVPVIQDYLSPFIANVKQGIAQSGFNIQLSKITPDLIKAETGKDFQQTVLQDYLSDPRVQASMVGKEKFLSADHRATLLLLKTNPNLSDTQQVALANGLEKMFKEKLSGVPGLKIDFSGDPTLARDFDRHIKNKTILLFVLAILFVVLILFLAFRRSTDTLVPLAVMIMSLVWTFGLLGYLHIPYSIASVAIMPLLLGHALTFIVPFVARYYEEAGPRIGALEAITKTMRTVGIALFPAALTSIAGFLVFEFSVLPVLKEFGLTAAIGTGFLFVLSITLLPAIIVLRDRKLEGGAIETEASHEFREHFTGFRRRQAYNLFTRTNDRILDLFGRLSTQHATIVIIVMVGLIVIGFLGSLSLTTDSDLRKLVPRDLPSIKSDFLLEKYFGPQQTDVVLVKGDVTSPEAVKAMADFESAVAHDPGNTITTLEKGKKTTRQLFVPAGINGLPDVVLGSTDGQVPATKAQVDAALSTAAVNGAYVDGVLSPSRKQALIQLNGIGATSTDAVNAKMRILETNAKKYLEPAGLSYEFGGISPLTRDLTKNIIPTETWSSVLSLFLSAILLILLFWSVPFGLITMAVAFAGVSGEIAFLWALHYPIDIVTSLSSALVIGIGSNFGILFTHRFIQDTRLAKMNPLESIQSTMKNLGRANIVAAISTIGGFLIIMLSQIQPLKRFGGVTAFGLLCSLIAALTLMPALLYKVTQHNVAHEEKAPSAEPGTEPI
jgi:hypothetical protein